MARRQARKPGQGRNFALQLEELEPRLLLSADVAGAFAPEIYPTAQPVTDILLDEDLEPVSPAPAGADSEDQRLELVFIDTDTPDYWRLCEDLLAERNDGRRIDVILLDNERDGVSQISEVLETHRVVDAIHLVSHAADGQLDLGNTTLTAANFADFEQSIADWGATLSDDADILVYGCNLAAGAEGEALVARLALMTGADVAASDDVTGHAELGGDWDLEHHVGSVETQIAITADTLQSWNGALDITTGLVGHYAFEEGSGTSAADSSATGNDGTLVAGAGFASGTIGSFALDTGGNLDHLQAADVAATDFGSGDFSVSFWVNSNHTGSLGVMVSDAADTDDGWAFYANASGGAALDIYSGAQTISLSAASVMDGTWHLVTGVRSGSDFELYIDG